MNTGLKKGVAALMTISLTKQRKLKCTFAYFYTEIVCSCKYSDGHSNCLSQYSGKGDNMLFSILLQSEDLLKIFHMFYSFLTKSVQ